MWKNRRAALCSMKHHNVPLPQPTMPTLKPRAAGPITTVMRQNPVLSHAVVAGIANGRMWPCNPFVSPCNFFLIMYKHALVLVWGVVEFVGVCENVGACVYVCACVCACVHARVCSCVPARMFQWR